MFGCEIIHCAVLEQALKFFHLPFDKLVNGPRSKQMLFIALLVALFACSVNVHAQQVIDAPTPVETHKTTFVTVTHYTLLAGVAGARAADWASTSQALRSGLGEGELPYALAGSKPGLATFEVGSFAVEACLSQRLSRRHPKLAIVGDAISFASIALTDIHNYRLLAAVHH